MSRRQPDNDSVLRDAAHASLVGEHDPLGHEIMDGPESTPPFTLEATPVANLSPEKPPRKPRQVKPKPRTVVFQASPTITLNSVELTLKDFQDLQEMVLSMVHESGGDSSDYQRVETFFSCLYTETSQEAGGSPQPPMTTTTS
jgi:hypothetical protein